MKRFMINQRQYVLNSSSHRGGYAGTRLSEWIEKYVVLLPCNLEENLN